MSGGSTTKHINDTMNELAESQPIATPEDVKKATRDALVYILNDAYVADVSAILGRVYYEEKGSDSLRPFAIAVAAKVDPDTRLRAPQTVSELIVNSKLKAKADALSFLSVQLNTEELLEVRVINNASARLNDKGDEWEAAIEKWYNNVRSKALLDDANVGTISVVTGAVQKYFTTKKYKKFDASAKGGAFGVNVEGSLYTSTSQFELSVVYGLDLVTLQRAKNVTASAADGARREVVTSRAGLAGVKRQFAQMANASRAIFPLPARRKGQRTAR